MSNQTLRPRGQILGAVLALCLTSFAGAQEVPASVTAAIKKAEAGIAWIIRQPDDKRTFDNTLGAMDRIQARMNRETNLTVFMQFVSPDAATRDAARAGDEAISSWGIALSKNEAMFKAMKAYENASCPV